MRNSKILLIMVLGLFFGLAGNVFGAEAIRVAILDSGSNINFKEGVNFVDDTLKDFNGHGTLMSQIIKEACPSAEFYIVKVIGKNGLVIHEDAVILGLEWAISRNVKVINMSLRIQPSEMLNAVIKKAHDKGIILVSAAGNNDQHGDSYYSALEARGFAGSGNFNADVAYPAKYPEVIAVGALDKYGKIYDQSVQSSRVDLYFKGYHGRKAGTSVASAYVAGTIARVLSARASSGARTKFIAQEEQMLELISSVDLRCT